MISDYLNQDYVLAQARAQRDWFIDLLTQVRAGNTKAQSALARNYVTAEQIERAIAALDAALATEKPQAMAPGSQAAFIPSNPVLCGFQSGLTEMAEERANTVSVAPSAPLRRSPGAAAVIDTSATERLKRPSAAGKPTDGPGEVTRAPFVEGDDIHYGLDGFMAKFGALFRGKHKFNKRPARVATTDKEMNLFIFGDWGTGLPLAQKVSQQIRRLLDADDSLHQRHVIHLGDVYYAGERNEYVYRVLSADMWPVRNEDSDKIGSWSLNGNHDMYAGGHGYFDTLLRDGRFRRWHADESGESSSFFLIENPNWQVFGLDTSWNTPSLGEVVVGAPTLKDLGGQNGILTPEQAVWMAKVRNPAKGCILLTHHQPAASRHNETQHSDEAVKLLQSVGVYDQIDAWIWGHEHRCVVFKPKEERTHPRLAQAPPFCACVGHGGVPVTKENFEADKTIADVLWQEDRFNENSPLYEGEAILPFGFACVETAGDRFNFRIIDHNGVSVYRTTIQRQDAPVARGITEPEASRLMTRTAEWFQPERRPKGLRRSAEAEPPVEDEPLTRGLRRGIDSRPPDLALGAGAIIPMPIPMPKPEGPASITCHFRAETAKECVLNKKATVEVTVSREELQKVIGHEVADGVSPVDPTRHLKIQFIPKRNVALVEGTDEELLVDPPETNNPVLRQFDFVPTNLGDGEIWVRFWQRQAPVLTLVLKFEILPPGAKLLPDRTEASSVAVEAPVNSPKVDRLTIIELSTGTSVVYRYEFDSPTLGSNQVFKSEPFKTERTDFITRIYDKIESLWPVDGNLRVFESKLQAYGATLLDQLFPAELKQLLWDHRASLHSIQVFSEEPFIPWEILHLKDRQNGVDAYRTWFLGELGLVRWLHNTKLPPEALSVRPGKARYLVPQYHATGYDLPAAQEEKPFLIKRFGATECPANSAAVQELLKTGDFDLLHFAGHGDANLKQIDDSGLLVSAETDPRTRRAIVETLEATEAAQLKPAVGTEVTRPLVVLNACRAGRVGWSLTRLGGFAEAFLHRDAGLFVGALWSVGDVPARTFTEAFYTALLDGKTVSQATTLGRQAARTAGDATWLAYSVYGHPHAKLSPVQAPPVMTSPEAPIAVPRGLVQAPEPASLADWTILVYMAGDNNLDNAGENDLDEMKRIGSSAQLHVIVQRDSAADKGARRYRVQKGTTLEQDELANLGRTNCGDPAALKDFLEWGLREYPAKRTMAVLWNHGSGWDDTDIYAEARRRGMNPPSQGFAVKRGPKPLRPRGHFFLTSFKVEKAGGLSRAIAFDDDAQDFLDSVEMKNVFAEVVQKAGQKFEVIGMDACLMSMVETGLQVRNSGAVFCGSQEVEPGAGWPYDRILSQLVANSAMDGKGLATIIVNEFVKSYPNSEPVTQSAFDLAAMDQVERTANALGDLLSKVLTDSLDFAAEGAIGSARRRAQNYEHADYVDLWDFCDQLAQRWPGSADATTAVKQAVEACVFANRAPHSQVGRSHGLSIYLPLRTLSPLYANLDFGRGGWAGFVSAFTR